MSAPDPRDVFAGILWPGHSGEDVRAAADQFVDALRLTRRRDDA